MSGTVDYKAATISGAIFSGVGTGLVAPSLVQSNVQTFQGPGTPVATGGTFTWVKPLAGSQVLVECWGGGGSGAGGAHAGGGGGGYVSNTMPFSSITVSTVAITVGAGGAPGGVDGTASTFGPITGAPGGSVITGPFGGGAQSGAGGNGGGGGGMASPGGPLSATAGAQGGGTGGTGPGTSPGSAGNIYGGGGGGAGPVSAPGGSSVYGGGGGGSVGGSSVYGGAGGSGPGVPGVVPGGGGGAGPVASGGGGGGASGRVRVTVF